MTIPPPRDERGNEESKYPFGVKLAFIGSCPRGLSFSEKNQVNVFVQNEVNDGFSFSVCERRNEIVSCVEFEIQQWRRFSGGERQSFERDCDYKEHFALQITTRKPQGIHFQSLCTVSQSINQY